MLRGTRRFRRLGVALAVVIAVGVAVPASASAGLLGGLLGSTVRLVGSVVGGLLVTEESVRTCEAPLIEHPFAPWGDHRDYTLAPDADFENPELAGWQLRGAQRVAGNEPFKVHREQDASSLRLRVGQSAVSPLMCVDLNYPTFRLFAEAQGEGARLKIEVAYPKSKKPSYHEVGSLSAADYAEWKPSEDVNLVPERAGSKPGARGLALRFTAVGPKGSTASWRIDDVYVDPRYR
jgi:hypothetical protein